MDQDAIWHGGTPSNTVRPRPHCVGVLAPPPRKGNSSRLYFSANCGQMPGCIMIPLGTEIALGPGDIVLDGNPAPPMEWSTAAAHFSAHVYYGQTVAHLSN